MNNATDYDDFDDQDKCDFHAPDACPSEGNVNVCFNCRMTCDTLHYVPEFDYMGCSRCLDDAMETIAAEAATARKPVATETCPFCHSGSLGSIGPLAECRNCHQVWNPAIAEVS